MTKSTMVEFVEELRKFPQHPEVVEMVMDAAAGEFHDFKNDKYMCGKVTACILLVNLSDKYHDLHSECQRLVREIQNGDYDEKADEGDIKRMSDDIDQGTSDPEEAAALKKLLGFDQL